MLRISHCFFKDLYISFLFRVNEDTITHGLSSEWKHRLDEQLLFFFYSRCCHCDYVLYIVPLKWKYLDLQAQEVRALTWCWCRCFAFLLSIFRFFSFFISLGLPLSNYYRARCDTKHINSEIYFLRVAFDNSML